MAKEWRKRSARENPSSYDVLIEKIIPVGKRRMSAHEVGMRQLYGEALQGDLRAVRAIMLMIHENQAEKLKRMPRGPRTEWKNDSDRCPDSARSALVLLRLGGHGDANSTDFGLEPWLLDMAAERIGMAGTPAKPIPPRYVLRADYHRPPASPPEGYCCEYARPTVKRSSVETRFPKGKSPNPLGRPPKLKVKVPFPFLEEEVEVSLFGEACRMTRAEVLLHQLALKAMKGDLPLRRLLAKVSAREEADRWKREEHEILTINETRLPDDSIFRDREEFSVLLRQLRIVNRHNRKYELLEPWVIEAALARHPDWDLCVHRQAQVVLQASTPEKIAWPAWWSVRSKADARKLVPPVRRRRLKRNASRIREARDRLEGRVVTLI